MRQVDHYMQQQIYDMQIAHDQQQCAEGTWCRLLQTASWAHLDGAVHEATLNLHCKQHTRAAAAAAAEAAMHDQQTHETEDDKWLWTPLMQAWSLRRNTKAQQGISCTNCSKCSPHSAG
jgi:hypothetical protein